ncbi:MAG TPA: glutathione-disulfide reductase [Steroidobacteraceae bacterium]|nr:glutathione-disulfide reductase [Steroidobacteraceae bacterium]
MAHDYDLFVIGAGSGGVRASRIASSHGAKVGIAEEYRVGGTCVIRGCVPKKLLVFGSHFREELEDAASYGWLGIEGKFDWPTLRDNVQKEVTRLNGAYISTLEKNHVGIVPGRAVFLDAHTIEIAGRRITAKHFLVATGGHPILPKFPGAELGFDSNEAFLLEKLPRRLVISGGGYIATEFAGIFAGLGVEVTQLYRGHLILKGWDAELREKLQAAYLARGIRVKLGAEVAAVERAGSHLTVTLKDGATLETDGVMHAIGRQPNTAGLGLERAGVAVDQWGAVTVDRMSKSSVDPIYAIGDVTNRLQLTPIAIREGHAFADSVFGNAPWSVDHTNVPTAVFSQPALASVGMTEEAARASGFTVAIFRSDFRAMKNTIPGRQERTTCKLVVDGKTDKVLGAHMLGPDAPEIIQALAIAVKMGATKRDFDQTVALHPSVAEEFVLMR